MVVEKRPSNVQITVSCLENFRTQLNVIECDFQSLIKATDFIEYCLPDRETCAVTRRHLTRDIKGFRVCRIDAISGAHLRLAGPEPPHRAV